MVNIVLVSIAAIPRYNSLLIAVGLPLLIMAISSIFTSWYTKVSRSRAQDHTGTQVVGAAR